MEDEEGGRDVKWEKSRRERERGGARRTRGAAA